MIRRTLWICFFIAFLFSGISILCFTETGLFWDIEIAKKLLPGKLQIINPRGALFEHVSFDNFSYEDKYNKIILGKSGFIFNPEALLFGKLHFNKLFIDSITLETQDIETAKPKKSNLYLPNLNFLYYFKVDDLVINTIEILSASKKMTTINTIHFKISHRNNTLVWSSSLNVPQYGNFTSAGEVDNQWRGTWKIDLKNLSKFDKDLSGIGTLAGTIDGTRGNPMANGTVNIQDFSYDKDYLTPTLLANFTLTLEKHKPIFKLNLTPTSLKIKELGLKLKKIIMTVTLESGGQLTTTGSLVSGSGLLNFTGAGKLDKEHFKTILQVTGKDVEIYKSNEYQINANPQTELTFLDNSLAIKGDIEIPSANIQTSESSTDLVTLPSDVKIIKQKKPKRAPSNFALLLDLQVKLGDNIRLNTHGVTGKLVGEGHLSKNADKPITAMGKISLINGLYQAHGQKLTISTGNLVYLGSNIDNPNLEILAVRQLKYLQQNTAFVLPTLHAVAPLQQADITVGVNIRGTAKKPIITLFSRPAGLSQSDILAFLILGRPINQATNADDISIGATIASLGLSSTEIIGLQNKIQKNLHLNELSVQTIPTYDPTTNTITNNTSLVLGKALSSNWYINYSIGLQAQENIFTTSYRLNKFFVIRSQNSSQASGIDIMFSLEK